MNTATNEINILVTKMRDPSNGISIKDRRWFFRTYPTCFVGSELVDWMVTNGVAESRSVALAIGQNMLSLNLFKHVTKDHPFKDEYLFYRFAQDELTLRGIEGENISWVDLLPVNASNEQMLPAIPALDQEMQILKTFVSLPLDVHNSRLLDNVHPARFNNPEGSITYNILVIGAGAAGLVTAAGSAGVGAKVALIEENLLGGDCLNFGCVPSKALLRCARAIGELKEIHKLGVYVEPPRIDFAAIMARMRKLRADLSPNDSVSRFQNELGVDVFIGKAKFLSKDTVDVDGKQLKFAKCCIATGASAAVPQIPGLLEVPFLTNITIFNLQLLPPRLGIIGAGPIGCEMAQAFARFGSQVTIFARSASILEKEDIDAASVIEKALESDGVIIIKNCTFLSVSNSQNSEEKQQIVVKIQNGTDISEIIFDQLLVSTGRKPNVTDMNLELASVEYNNTDGILVNENLQTTNAKIYAAGDCCTRFKYTHVADFSARIVIRNALFWGSAKISQLIIPWCTYTDPEIAHVGLYERDLQQSKTPYQIFTKHLKDLDRAILDEDADFGGFIKIITEKNSDKILGATIVARNAGDMISEITTAMVAQVGLSTISTVIHPYPTQADGIRQVGDMYNRTRLTPTTRLLLRKLLETIS
eukprot:TRINITY_DN7931_c0_g1_i1.p1 TRINITY_DN7931_c0_g1~~TRINITY_DN7931_c0_g1_i1.p1  ORF type:complete len:662 (-),score=300.30 TRINITY_DN7931_c0_g1_i1:64-2001(-)